MGYFKRMRTADIMPREFAPPTKQRKCIYIWWLIDYYLNGEGDAIISPAVKRLDDSKAVTVDGHNRLLIADLFKGESNVYIPSHKHDFFTEETTPGISDFTRRDLNYTIQQCFDNSDKISYGKGLSFSEIRCLPGYWFLKDVDAAKAYYLEWKSLVEERARVAIKSKV
jgi:hypothetical protein